MEEDLDEDTRACSGVFLCKSDGPQTAPCDAVGVEQVTKELCAIPKLVDLHPVHSLILPCEVIVEQCPIHLWVHQTEALRNLAEESQVSALLGAALVDHVGELDLLTGTDLQFEELVAALIHLS